MSLRIDDLESQLVDYTVVIDKEKQICGECTTSSSAAVVKNLVQRNVAKTHRLTPFISLLGCDTPLAIWLLQC